MSRLPASALIASLLIIAPYNDSPAQERAYEVTEITDGVYMFRYRAHNAMFVGMFRYGKAPETAFWPPGLIRRNPHPYWLSPKTDNCVRAP